MLTDKAPHILVFLVVAENLSHYFTLVLVRYIVSVHTRRNIAMSIATPTVRRQCGVSGRRASKRHCLVSLVHTIVLTRRSTI